MRFSIGWMDSGFSEALNAAIPTPFHGKTSSNVKAEGDLNVAAFPKPNPCRKSYRWAVRKRSAVAAYHY
jgi:hypothetical protein